MGFQFRLRFHLRSDTYIDIPDPIVELPATLSWGGPYVLKSVGDSPIRESRALVVESRGGFPTDADAATAGRMARAALLYAAAKLRIGIDVGRNLPIGGLSKFVRDQVRLAHHIEARNDVHGVATYEESMETVFVSASASLTVGRAGMAFLDAVSRALEQNLVLSDRKSLAFELYGLFPFESSLRARFLTLIMIVETLTDNASRPPKALAHIESLIVQTRRADLEDGEQASILQSLQWLRLQSIGQKTKKLIATSLGDQPFSEKQATKFFRDCYEVRSQLTHYGKIPPELDRLMPELERLVAELLLSLV